VACRIVAALRGGGRFVLVAGEPPADPKFLSQPLGNVAGPGYKVINIRCGPQADGQGAQACRPRVGGAENKRRRHAGIRMFDNRLAAISLH